MRTRTARADVTPIRQRTQYTCMSTSLTMALQALGYDLTEDDVNRVIGARPMQGAAWESILAAAQHFGCRATLTCPSTVKQIKEWTDAGTPVMIAWNPEGRPWSHASLVYDVVEGPIDDPPGDAIVQGSGPGLYVYVADPNIPHPEKTTRIVHENDFYSKWYEKWPDYLVRRPACAIAREITPEGRQVLATTRKSASTALAERFWQFKTAGIRVEFTSDTEFDGLLYPPGEGIVQVHNLEMKSGRETAWVDMAGVLWNFQISAPLANRGKVLSLDSLKQSAGKWTGQGLLRVQGESRQVPFSASFKPSTYFSDALKSFVLGKVAMDFPSEGALKKYLKEHPGADKHRHKVVEKKPVNPKHDKDWDSVPDIKPEDKEVLKEYSLTIVGDDVEQAAEIVRKIRKGIDRAADICKMSPSVCRENKGLTRDKMPQIEGEKSVKQMLASKDPVDQAKGKAMVQAGADPDSDEPILKQMLDTLAKRGVKTKRTTMPVGHMKATQQEIQAFKVYGMADNYLKNDFAKIGDTIVVSKDGHILDGHHRWAALLTLDPGRKMDVLQVDLTMNDLLKEAASFPGVYKADFKGNPLPEKDQKEYKAKNKSRFPSKTAEDRVALRYFQEVTRNARF